MGLFCRSMLFLRNSFSSSECIVGNVELYIFLHNSTACAKSRRDCVVTQHLLLNHIQPCWHRFWLPLKLLAVCNSLLLLLPPEDDDDDWCLLLTNWLVCWPLFNEFSKTERISTDMGWKDKSISELIMQVAKRPREWRPARFFVSTILNRGNILNRGYICVCRVRWILCPKLIHECIVFANSIKLLRNGELESKARTRQLDFPYVPVRPCAPCTLK